MTYGMATRLARVHRAYDDAEIPFIRVASKPVRRIPAADPLDAHDPMGASRGTLFGLLLCVPLWAGVSLIVFSFAT
jgi:hypothetical protein